MAKTTKRPKHAPTRTPTLDEDREHTRLALRRAVRREMEIQRLLKQIKRLEAKSDAELQAFASDVAKRAGLELLEQSIGGEREK